MASTKRNPSAGGAGARETDLLATARVSFENIEPHSLQVKKLIARFRLEPIRAELVARLAWGARP